MTGNCYQCRFWGDGINDKNDASRWERCHGDGKGWFAHREFSCRMFERAQTLKNATQVPPRRKSPRGAILGAARSGL
jgi:hypothetical protein